jgi:hypothetical protein
MQPVRSVLIPSESSTGTSEPPYRFFGATLYLLQVWGRRPAAFVGVAALLLSWYSVAAPRKPMTTVDVEIDLYSGRENPAWKLGGVDAARLLTLVAELPRNSGIIPAMPERLGYRGLRLAVTSAGATERFVIAYGNVTIESAKATQWRNFRDPNRALEKWLLRTGKQQLGEDLIEYLLAN